MQIPKSLLIIFMAALGVSSLHAQRADSDVQAKAREQLRQKLSDLNSQPSSNPAPAPAAKPAAASAVQKAAPQQATEAKPFAAPAPVTQSGEPAPVYSALDAQQDTKAREALRQKMQELKAQDQAAAPAQTAEPVPSVGAKKQKTTQVVSAEPKKTKVARTANNDPAFGAVEVAPAPALNSREAKLADLLQQYKADRITPTEYHIQRAKVLSEP